MTLVMTIITWATNYLSCAAFCLGAFVLLCIAGFAIAESWITLLQKYAEAYKITSYVFQFKYYEKDFMKWLAEKEAARKVREENWTLDDDE